MYRAARHMGDATPAMVADHTPANPAMVAAPSLHGPGSGHPQLRGATCDSHPETVTHIVTLLSLVSLGTQ